MQARLVRRWLRRLTQQARFRQLSLAGVPVLFANSFPKSGTHLLTQILEGFARLGPAVISGLPAIVTYQGNTGYERPPQEILADLNRLLPADIAYGHLHAQPEVVSHLNQPGFATYFILRDPRDVVVSHVHYITEMEPNHIHHRYYTEGLHTFDERLRTSIQGIPDPNIPFPDIAARFQPFLGWLDQAQVLTLRYEDFITDRDGSLGKVLDHAVQAGFPLGGKKNTAQLTRQAALQVLADSIDPQRSPTFRSGKIGGWKEKFSDENTHLFKEISGDLLMRLGYEQDNDW